MPFTFSHPALILPLLNKGKKLFSVTGLVIGSIIPDFESFTTLNEYKWHSHRWLGAFWYDLPMALVAAFIFHSIVRNPLIKNLPDFIGNKFVRSLSFRWVSYFRKHFLVVLSSMLIGILSHLLWDAITHLNFSFPDSRASEIYFHKVRLYMILQYASSVVGLVVVAWYILSLPTPSVSKRKHRKNIFYIGEDTRGPSKWPYWITLSIVTATTMALAIRFLKDRPTAILLIEIFISGVLLGLVLTPLLQKAVRFRK